MFSIGRLQISFGGVLPHVTKTHSNSCVRVITERLNNAHWTLKETGSSELTSR